MKITIEINTKEDVLNAQALAQLVTPRDTPHMQNPAPVATPPEGLDMSNSDDERPTVSVYTSEANVEEAKKNCNLDDQVAAVEVEAEAVVRERHGNETPAEEGTVTTTNETESAEAKKTRKRRTKAEIAQDKANETGEDVPFEYKGDAYVAKPGGAEPMKVKPVEPATESLSVDDVCGHEEVDGEVPDLRDLQKPTSEPVREKKPEAKTDELDSAVPSKPKEAPAKPHDVEGNAAELRTMMVLLVKKFGAKGTKMTAKIIKDHIGTSNMSDVHDEAFPAVFAALNEALEADVEQPSGNVDY